MTSDQLISDSDLLGAEFEWSGMWWRVTAIKGDRCWIARRGEPDPVDPPISQTAYRYAVESHVLYTLARRPKRPAAA